MNRAELCESIAKDLKTTKAEADRFLTATLNGIVKGLKKDKEKGVQLVGFGTFTVKKRAARKGRNPQTGESIKIKASKTVGFKAGKGLKDKI